MADVVVWAALFPFMSDSSPSLGKLPILLSHSNTRVLISLGVCSPPQHGIFPDHFYLPSHPAVSVEPSPLFAFPGEWKCVQTWFDRGALVHGFQSAAQKVLQGKGLQGMKSYMQRQPAPQSSQSRETPPCNSSPAEVLAGSLG